MQDALLTILQPHIVLFMAMSVACGIIVGAIPGLTATMAMALLVPLTYSMDSSVAFPVLCAIYVGGVSGGLYSAILLKIPGTSSSIATTFDGFPMARKGQSSKAVGIALIASFVGSAISFALLGMFAPMLARVALKFGPAEYFAVSLLGLSTIAAVIGNSTIKGLMAACLGLVFGTVGLDVIMGIPRFTGGSPLLISGFDVLAVMIGFFAVPQMMKDALNPQNVKVETDTRLRSMLPSLKELKAQIINFIRSGLIGTWVGLLPGAGGSIASLLSYDQAKKASKHPEKFGTGVTEGVVASETANNAVIGGSLIPMLTLGIPGDSPAAILLAALTLHGLQAGPLLYKQNPHMVNMILGSLFISNILMILIAFFGARFIIKALGVRKNYLLPLVLLMCVVGTFAANQRAFDIVIMVVMGLVGFAMERYGMPVSPLVLGVILGPLLEKNFRRAVVLSNNGILGIIGKPITAVILLMVLFNFSMPLIHMIIKKRKERKGKQVIEEKEKSVENIDNVRIANRYMGILGLTGSIVYFLFANGLENGVTGGSAYGPGFYPKILAGIFGLLSLLLIATRPPVNDKIDEVAIPLRRMLIIIAALIVYPIAVIQIGFVVSSMIMLIAGFLYLGNMKKKLWMKPILLSVIFTMTIYYVFEKIFIIILPHGLLF